MGKHKEKAVSERSAEKPTPPTPWPWISSLPNCEKMHLWCFSHLTCGIYYSGLSRLMYFPTVTAFLGSSFQNALKGALPLSLSIPWTLLNPDVGYVLDFTFMIIDSPGFPGPWLDSGLRICLPISAEQSNHPFLNQCVWGQGFANNVRRKCNGNKKHSGPWILMQQ